MDRALLFTVMVIATASSLLLARKRSPLHLFTIAVVSTALVGSFFPVFSAFVEPLSWRNAAHAPDAEVSATQGEFVAFAIGLFCAALCASFAGGLDEQPERPERRPRRADLRTAAALVVIGAALYTTYCVLVGLDALTSTDDYAEKYLRSIGLGPFLIGINAMIAGCLWAEAGDVSPHARVPFRIVAALIAAWSIAIVSVRTNAVILAVGYAWILCARRRITLRDVRPVLVVALLVFYATMETFSLYRGAVHEAGADRAVDVLANHPGDSIAAIVGGSELSHPFLTTVEVEQSERPGELAGESYLTAFAALAPLALVPDRPEALAEKFVRVNYADLAERGGGTAFALVAEAWWNFGSLSGPLLIGLLFGLACLWAESRALSRPEGVLARLVPYFTFLVVIAHRSESAVILKQIVSILVPVALALVVAALLGARGFLKQLPTLDRNAARA